MTDPREESTETFVRKHVEPCVERHVDKCMAEHSEKTQHMNALTMDSMEKILEFQEVMTETIRGRLPPDPDKPGMWEIVQNLLNWKKNANKVVWIGATAALTALVTTIWAMITQNGAS